MLGLRMGGAILLPILAFMAWTGMVLPLFLQSDTLYVLICSRNKISQYHSHTGMI
jgi:hypothetical protein